MPPQIPTTEPTRLHIGTTWKWTKSLADYRADDGWTLTYALRGISGITFDATPSGALHSVTVAATASAALEPGMYELVGYAKKAGEIYEVAHVRIQLEANAEAAQPGELQSFNERMLAAIEARLAGRLEDEAAIESYGVAGRQVQKIPFERLESARRRYRTAVIRERRGGRLPSVVMRFGLTS